MPEVEELSGRRHIATHLATRPIREMTHKMHCQAILMCFPHFFTHTINAYITHGIVRRLLERKL